MSSQKTSRKDQPAHEPTQNYIKLDKRLLCYWLPVIGDKAVILYELIVAAYNSKLGYAYPSLSLLRSTTGYHPTTIQKGIETLKAYKLIEKERGGGRRANRYIPQPLYVDKKILDLIESKGRKPFLDFLHLWKQRSSPAQKCITTKTYDDDQTESPGVVGTNLDRLPTQKCVPIKDQVNKNDLNLNNNNLSDLTIKDMDSGQSVVSNEDIISISAEDSLPLLIEALATTMEREVTDSEVVEFVTRVLSKYDVHRVTEKLNMLASQIDQIQQPFAWLRAACRDDYRPEWNSS